MTARSVQREELKAALAAGGKRASDAGVQQIIREVDTNQDGLISFEEFRRIFETSPDALPVGLKQLVAT